MSTPSNTIQSTTEIDLNKPITVRALLEADKAISCLIDIEEEKKHANRGGRRRIEDSVVVHILNSISRDVIGCNLGNLPETMGALKEKLEEYKVPADAFKREEYCKMWTGDDDAPHYEEISEVDATRINQAVDFIYHAAEQSMRGIDPSIHEGIAAIDSTPILLR